MKNSILLIISLFLAVTVSAQDVSSALRQAQARFESGNETGGIELVNKVLAKYPGNKEAKDLLAKFNQTIKDREIDADWKVAQTQNTFESYQQFRTKHPGSKYDDTASDNMAKKLADKFNVNSTYADRTKAESYAKKTMTKDYIANKWKAAMSKKTTSTSSSTSSTSSYNSSSSSSRSYSSGSSTSSSRYGSSYGSYGSTSSSSGYYGSRSYTSESIPNKSKFAIGIEGSIEGLQSFSTGWGLSMRLGAFNSMFNFTIGAKYQYTVYSKWISYSFKDYYGDRYYDYDYVMGFADYKRKVNQFVFPMIINWNVARHETFAFYLGLGYEHGVLMSDKYAFSNSDSDFNEYDFYRSDEADDLVDLSIPSRSVVLQMGFSGRHCDWKMYYKIHTNKSYSFNAEVGAIGTAFIYYF
ncbi:MAG: hypothetical protein ACI3YY_03840 [Candidatus Cryptobacteroides sp.]